MNKTKLKKLENQNQVRDLIRQDTWCTAHVNCFRASFGKAESKEHIVEKFNRWMHWRYKGFDVLVEGRFVNNLRPDLIVWNENEVFIEEIAHSEKEASLIKKKENYPLPVYVQKWKQRIKKRKY
tara:strand:+ start:189 stop:560 length:372 start_codon:yes stop_codon:yes gene_type:complete